MCAVTVIAGLIAGTYAPNVSAFDWNGRTVTHEFDVLNGRMQTTSGHPLATARSFELAADVAATDASGRLDAALSFVYGADYVERNSDAVQTVLFGSWLNEVRTSLDMGEGGLFDPMAWAARFMRWRYGRYLDERERSDRWSASSGYSSNNYQHAMMVASIDQAEVITQDDVFDLLEEYTFWAISSAAMNLMVAKKAELDGGMDAEDIDLSWVAGMRYLGNVFHLIEDSSVTCSPGAHAHVPTCIPGDGHTMVEEIDGRPQVVALADNDYYERRGSDGRKVHGVLDGLYRVELLDEVFGANDPALDTSRILIATARGVDAAVHEDLAMIPLHIDGETNAEFDRIAFGLAVGIANEIMADVVEPRFARAVDRVDLPPLEAPADDLGPSTTQDDPGAQGCAVGVASRTWPLAGMWMIVLVGAGLRSRRRTHHER